MLTSVEIVCALAHDGIDTAYAGTDGCLGEDVDHTDLADVVHVGTTAQLTAPAVFADGHHAHDVAIFLAEQVHGTEGDGIVELHFLGGHGEVVAQLVVDALLNSGNHGLGRSLGPLEIETQTVRGVFGTTLSGLRAELFAQRFVYHVRGGVRTGNGATAGQIDVRIDFSAHDQRAFSQAALVNDEVLDGLLHVVDFEHGAVIGENLTLIGKLTAGLRIERGTVEDDLDVGRAGHGGHGALAFLHDADHLARADMSV